MKTKILNIVNIVYNIFKQDIWPYRYIILLFFLMITSFAIEMLTYTRILRFTVICIMLIIYKKAHEFMKQKDFENINIKYMVKLMKINTWQNPLLYLTWKWDLYMYNKLEKWIHKNIKNKWFNRLLIVVLWNLTVPIKIIYLRFYVTLNQVKDLTLKSFFFDRIYGFLLSILVFSDVIKYIYNVTGGFLNLMMYLYVLLYSINLLYVYYIYFMENKLQNEIVNKIIALLKKTLIFNILINYMFIRDIVYVYAMRVEVSLIGTIIKKVLIKSLKKVTNVQENERLKVNILILKKYLYEIPDNWRYWFYANFKMPIFFSSYFDSYIQLNNINQLKLNQAINDLTFKQKYFKHYYIIYNDVLFFLTKLFEALETALYYKCYVLKKGTIKDDTYIDKRLIKLSNVEYEFIYKTYKLILKNILHFIWSFEYNILRDKNKLTKFYVIDENDLDLGYHIYPKNKNEYNPYETFLKFKIINSATFLEKIDKDHDKYDAVYESIQVLFNLISDSEHPSCMYIRNKENSALNILDTWYYMSREKLSLNNLPENDTSELKPEVAQEYFSELKDLMAQIREEWEINGAYNIYEKRDVFKELSQHLLEIKKV